MVVQVCRRLGRQGIGPPGGCSPGGLCSLQRSPMVQARPPPPEGRGLLSSPWNSQQGHGPGAHESALPQSPSSTRPPRSPPRTLGFKMRWFRGQGIKHLATGVLSRLLSPLNPIVFAGPPFDTVEGGYDCPVGVGFFPNLTTRGRISPNKYSSCLACLARCGGVAAGGPRWLPSSRPGVPFLS